MNLTTMNDGTTDSNTSFEQFDAILLKGIVSAETMKLSTDIMEAGFVTTLAIVGMAGNLLSVIAFYKMGYQETMNISLTFICTVDFVRCLFAFVCNIHFPIRLFSLIWAEIWFGVNRVTVSFLSAIGNYVSSILAAYVSLERCLCVSIPFSVKYLLTPRVVWITNIVLTFIVLGSMLAYYSCYTIVWIFNPELNATIPIQGLTPLYFEHPEMNIYMTVMGIAWLLLSFCIICICTVVITYHLRKSTKFKASVTQKDAKEEGLSSRDRQVIKMLVVIIMVYIGTTLPRILFFVGRVVFPDFGLYGKERNLFYLVGSVTTVIDQINPAVNIFIFYSMSSHYKKTFKTTFRCSKKKST